MSFTPANVPQTLWIGNHTTIIRGFKTTNAGVVTAISLIGKVVFFTVYNGSAKLIEKSTTAGSVTIQGVDNERAAVTITPSETRTLAAVDLTDSGGLVYEFEIRTAGVQETWCFGKLKLRGGANVDA